MGVPAFFRWLTKKYPQIIVYCNEEWTVLPEAIDTSTPNPNGVEFDNLYLDMNGIIHPCTHPENKPAPKDEDEMMAAIFECIDRLFAIVRPRKLLYMAIDGVAPRAKMNQQRSRRFRASKEAMEKAESIKRVRESLLAEGYTLPPEKTEHFDSNCITPGTPFMTRLSESLNYYILKKINGEDPGWKTIKIILSDASVPGEGEHKIMDYIRRQRSQPTHNPNTRHCLCGADADLIMLGLATHEPYFTIIREEFVYNNTPKCEICSLYGHEMKNCKGISDDVPQPVIKKEQEGYIFVNLYVLREYLESDLALPNIQFEYDFERVIDDWVFLCFFVGNDFLPHLPSMEIRENAIDRLINIYKTCMMRSEGYLTNSGSVVLERVQYILSNLAGQEDDIFRRRKQFENNQKTRNRERKMLEWVQNNGNKPPPEGYLDEPEIVDTVKLHLPGYKPRYYKDKFRLVGETSTERRKITACYVEGLCWVLEYYYQGCPSWEWFYPYHYAPFASDFTAIGNNLVQFPMDTKPFSPLEQLMGVFPAASSNHIPAPWAELMTDPNSPIRDFYPDDFKIDLNGKRYAWQGVALLPFVDASRLKAATSKVSHLLSKEECLRNTKGSDKLFIGQEAKSFKNVYCLREGTTEVGARFYSDGMLGTIYVIPAEFFQGTYIKSPVRGLPDLQYNGVLCVRYEDPQFPKGYRFSSQKLPLADVPEKILKRNKPEEWDKPRPRPQIGMAPAKQRAVLPPESFRMVGFYSQGDYHNPYHRDGTQNMTNWKGTPHFTPRNENNIRPGPSRLPNLSVPPPPVRNQWYPNDESNRGYGRNNPVRRNNFQGPWNNQQGFF